MSEIGSLPTRGRNARYYQINPASNHSLYVNLSNMDNVLQEVGTTYKILYRLLTQHQRYATIPEIEEYRDKLISLVAGGISNAELIAKNSRHMSVILKELNKEVTPKVL